MDLNQYLIDFYNSYDENERLRSRHGMVEFLTTMRYIEKYLKPGDRVLEIGAGTGRYSHTLARWGYAVNAVELVDHNIPGRRLRLNLNRKICLNWSEEKTLIKSWTVFPWTGCITYQAMAAPF